MSSTTPQRHFVELDRAVKDLWQHAIAPGTRQTYNTGYNMYIQFLLLSGVIACATPNNIPVSEDLLIYFVTHCTSTLAISYATIKIYLCGIRFMCLEHNIFYPAIHELSRLKAILNGVKRSQNKVSKPRYPITYAILKDVCMWLQKSCTYDHLLLETVCTVAFFGFLRCGEFTVSSQFDPTVDLCMNDMMITSDCVHLFLKISKTDPFRQGVTIKLFKTDSNICPVSSCHKYLQARYVHNPSTQDPLFVTKDLVPLTRAKFISMFKHVLECTGYDPTLYNGHSFRIGAATSAASSHVEDHLIKVLGRWSSDSYCRYIRTPDHVLRHAQISMTNT